MMEVLMMPPMKLPNSAEALFVIILNSAIASTPRLVPRMPVDGSRLVSVGAGGRTLKVIALLDPPAVVTAILRAPSVAPEYLALVDEQMRPVARVDARTVVLVAARVGKTRLIDNVVLGEGVASDIAVRA